MTKVLIGIDGGASKTRGALCDLEGNVLAEHALGRCVIEAVPSEATRETLYEMLEELLLNAGVSRSAVACCALGINGVDVPDQFPGQHRGATEALALDPALVKLVNDGIVALWGASPAEALAILQHGSGFTTAYRSTFGGEQLFDHLNTGKQFDFRRELVVLVARMLDGRAPRTALCEKALAHFGIDDPARYNELMFLGRIPNSRLLTTGSLVFAAWLDGDPAAAKLIETALEDYALTACTMLARTGRPDAQIAFGGGVLKDAPPRFWQALEAKISSCAPRAKVVRPELSPEYGALVMAAFHQGLNVPLFFSRLKTGRGKVER